MGARVQTFVSDRIRLAYMDEGAGEPVLLLAGTYREAYLP